MLKLKSGRRIAASGTDGVSHVSVTAIMSGCKDLAIILSSAILGRRLRALKERILRTVEFYFS